ncbi:MAG TPA: hypothetical protein VEW68_08185 [Patescibacteria group bacterium]|nr:hypothetical protein [Patescibacteria group bacterium]
MLEAAGASVAWLGASLIVLADGRRGLALGLAAIGLGMCAVAWSAGPGFMAGMLAIGGLVAAAQRLRSGPPGWAMMPPGSTPRLVLCVAAGLLALWIGAAVTSGPGASLRIAVLAVLGMTGVRVFTARQPDVAVSGVAGLVLASSAVAVLAGGAPQTTALVAGALIAAATSFIRLREPEGA